jgi:hypothetical protein
MTNMLVLFGRFYVKQYSGKADAKKQALLAAARSAAPAAAGQKCGRSVTFTRSRSKEAAGPLALHPRRRGRW